MVPPQRICAGDGIKPEAGAQIASTALDAPAAPDASIPLSRAPAGSPTVACYGRKRTRALIVSCWSERPASN